MEYIFIYLLQLGNVFSTLSIIFAIALAVTVIGTSVCFFGEMESNGDLDVTKSWGKTTVIVFAITSLLFLLPTKQTVLLFGGTYYGKKVVKNIATDEKIQKVNTIINLELDKRIKELKAE